MGLLTFFLVAVIVAIVWIDAQGRRHQREVLKMCLDAGLCEKCTQVIAEGGHQKE